MGEGPNILDIVIRMRRDGKSDEEIAASLQKMGVAAGDAAAALQKLGGETKKQASAEESLAEAMAAVREESEKRAALRSQGDEFRQGESVASAAAEKQAEATRAAASAAKENEAALAAEARALNEVAHEQDAAGAATKKASEQKKLQQEALKGAGRAFPEFIGHIRAMISPIGAAAAAIGFFISQSIRMRNERKELLHFAASLDVLRGSAAAFAEFRTSAAEAREQIVSDIKAMRDEVEAFTRAIDANAAAINANRAANQKSDDQILRRQLGDINARNIPQSEKNLLTSKAIAESEHRAEQNAIKQKEQDAATAAKDAKKARDQAFFKEHEAAGTDRDVEHARSQLDESTLNLDIQGELSKRLRDTKFDDDFSGEKWKKAMIENARIMAEAKKMVEDNTKELERVVKIRDQALNEVKGFRSKADSLDQAAAQARADAAALKHDAATGGSQRRANDEQERRRRYGTERNAENQSDVNALRSLRSTLQGEGTKEQMLQAMREFLDAVHVKVTEKDKDISKLVNEAAKRISVIESRLNYGPTP